MKSALTAISAELDAIRAWEAETGKQLLYPLVAENEYNPDAADANNWYKMDQRFNPVRVREDGSTGSIKYKPGMTLEDNYLRDADGNVLFYTHTGGGSFETSQYKVRVLYYNWYQYKYGFEPNYIMGTDSQGYDLALRIAGGDLNAVVGLAGFVVGILIGIFFLKQGFTLGRAYKQNKLEGVAMTGINVALLVILLAAQIIAVSDPELAAKLDAKRASDAAAVLAKDAALQEKLNSK